IQGGNVVMKSTNITITTPLNFKQYNVLYCDAVDISVDITAIDRDTTMQLTYAENCLKVITKVNLETIKYFMIIK
ncbi:hypothetical protein, partial [Gallibacterium anatis]|uniref:hypothetical protein n=1 Tax=Gallibacterium anatis TaxID=750 RepID=UPI001E4BEA68